MKITINQLLVLIFSVFFIGGVYFHTKCTKITALQAIPYNAALVIQASGIDSVLQSIAHNDDQVFRDLLKISFLYQLKNDLKTAQLVFPENTDFWGALLKNNTAIGVNLADTDSLHAIFAIDMEIEISVEKWLAESKTVLKKFPSSFKNQTIYTLLLPKGARFAACGYKNLLLFARYPYLIEDAITTLEKGNGIGQETLFEQNKDLQIGEASFYLNTNNFGEQIHSKLTNQWNELPDLITRNIQYLQFDYNGKKLQSKWKVNGLFSGINDWGTVERRDLFSILPDNTAALFWAGFQNKNSFYKNFNQEQSSDFQHFIQDWAGNECAFLLSEPFSENLAEEQFLIFSIKDSLRANARTEEYGQRYGFLKNYEYQTFKIRQFASQVPLFPILGMTNSYFRNPVCTQLGKYMVFAHSTSALERLVDKYVVNQTLNNQVDFLILQKNLASQGSGFILLNNAFLSNATKTIFTPKTTEKVANDLKIFKNLGLIGFDLTHNLEGIKNAQTLQVNLHQLSLATQKTETSILWKTPLSANIITTPVIINISSTNNDNKTTNQPSNLSTILVQDARYQLYCLNENGEILWKRQLKNKLNSTVHGVDYLRNGTQYYLCSTVNEILLLDEEGSDVDGFPLPLHSPATNGVAVAHFSESTDYGFFIACKNGNLYGFDRHGRPLPGWNPQNSMGIITHPLLHFQFENKDFLCILNQTGEVTAFARNGDVRFKTIKFEGKFNNPLQVDIGKHSPRLVAVNSTGKAYICTLKGKTFGLQISNPSYTQNSNFIFAPHVGDTRYDYVLGQGKNLSISGYDGSNFKNYGSKELKVATDTLFNIQLSTKMHQIGAINRIKQQIYLFDAQLNLHPDFPLAGSTAFSISDLFNDGKSNVLVVGNSFNLYAYKIK
jgi:hypothetical protein